MLVVLENVSAAVFVLLGIATGIGWIRRKDASMGWLALAIILLSFVFLVGRLMVLVPVITNVASEISLFAFVGSAYALLRFRGSLIPLSRRWHIAAVVAISVGIGGFVVSQLLGLSARSPLETAAVILLVLSWAAVVTEPIVRFWLVARGLPAVQAWRLRALSLGFAIFVAVLLFAVVAVMLAAANPAVLIAVQVAVIATAPLLYMSFSPPAWLRREWRGSEEEGLRKFMEELLLTEDRDALADRALEWSMRLVGGAAAVAFDGDGSVRTSSGLSDAQLAELKSRAPSLERGLSRIALAGSETTVIALPIAGLADSGTLVVLAGPFTPRFGADELSRVQQFMSAFVTALDRRHLIVELKESNIRLKEANRHKSVFVASMSHELRTPLNAILGFSELLMDADDGQYSTTTRTRFLEQIHSSGKHLLGLINDILDLSKIEAGQMELRVQTIGVAELIRQTLSTIEPLAVQKQIQIEAGDLEAGDIIADAGKFKQMLLNLVSNAVKFSPQGAVVTIRAIRLENTVEVSVADHGIGIAREDQERVFHEFQQVDSGVGRQQTGTGLGLTLTRRFADLHGGNVRVASELGKGSVFTISLPFQALNTQGLVSPATVFGTRPAAADRRPLVLVVEDDPPAAELLMRQIEGAGFRGAVARTGFEALAKARELKPAAITLDILLPDLDGWEVLTRLKQDEATSGIPVIVVSVVDNPELGMALGALDYFVKPVPAKEMMSRLAKYNFGAKAGEKATVLVVDDEEPNRDWLRRVLEPAGFSVIAASGGQEAIEMAKSDPPDLVMLDLMMPAVTGFDVVEALRADTATHGIPIMVLTAKSLTEADIRQLNGHVSTILRRGSTGAADLLGLLSQVVTR